MQRRLTASQRGLPSAGWALPVLLAGCLVPDSDKLRNQASRGQPDGPLGPTALNGDARPADVPVAGSGGGGTGGTGGPIDAPLPDRPAPAADRAPPALDVVVLRPDTAVPPADAPPSGDPSTCSPPGTTGSCPDRFFCSRLTQTCLAASTAMRWTFSHACLGAGTIQVVFFDGLHGGMWFGEDPLELPEGGMVSTEIACVAGGYICYGARSELMTSELVWGVDIDGSRSCTICCTLCAAVSVPVQTLDCK